MSAMRFAVAMTALGIALGCAQATRDQIGLFAEGGLYFLIRQFDPSPFCDSWRSLG